MSEKVQSRPWFGIIILVMAFIAYTYFLRTPDNGRNIEILFFVTWGIIFILFEALKYRLLLDKYSDSPAAVIAAKNYSDRTEVKA